jgi:hypothetical protein
MLLAKSITLKKIKALGIGHGSINLLLLSLIASVSLSRVQAQDNSPYSRYGIGTLTPSTNVVNRAMGGISAAYNDLLSVNFTNPASYSTFKLYQEARSKNTISGRVILDAGIDFSNRTLREGTQPDKFTSGDGYFSYVQVGIPLKKNWGLSFGIRPVSRIYYKINQQEVLTDPNSHLPIDSALTQFTGDGGAFLPTIGTGFAIKNLSLGVNMGYLFGRKDFSSKRGLFNDSTNYKEGNYETKTSFGSIFFSAGLQYKINLNKTTTLTLGAYGNMEQKLNASQDIIRETFVRNSSGADVTLDSVYSQKDIKGKIVYPAHYGVGITFERRQEDNLGGWLFGVDLVQNKWSNYRFYNTIDSVRDNWELHIGGQLMPAPKKNYFSNVAYRAGLVFGPDYIHVGSNMSQFGVSFGVGLPVTNYNRQAPGQFTMLNLAFEYLKRGNNNNLLKENLFRFSVGLNLSDLWFGKRKYD